MRVTPTTCRWPAATLAAALLATTAAAATEPPTGDPFDLAHPAVRAFSDRDGLPQNTVHGIARDPLGYLWVATQDGAARWNGREWLTIDMPDRDVSNYIRALVATRDCTIWFGREAGGLVRLRRDPLSVVPRRESFTIFGPAQGLAAPRVTSVFEASDGTIWAATAGGAARLVGERFETLRDGLKDPRLWVIHEIEDDAGRKRMLAGGEAGLSMLEGRQWSPIDLGPQPFVGSVNSLLQTKDRDGVRTLWVGTYGSGVLRIRRGHVERFGPAEGLSQPARHLARAHAARTRRRAALGGHARRRPLPPRRRALPGRAARPVDLGGVLAAGRRRGGPGRALGRHAHGGPAPPRGRLVAGARPLLGTAGRPGAGPAGDEGRRRAARLLGGNRGRPRRDPRRPGEHRGRGPGASGPAGAGARRAARARPAAGALGLDRRPRPGEARRGALGPGRRAARVHRRPRRVAAGLDGARRGGRAVGRDRAQRPGALRARTLDGAADEGRPPVGPRGGAARDRDRRQANALGGHARRRTGRGGGRPSGADLGPQLGAGSRRRADARGAAPRRAPRAVGGHALRRDAPRSRRALPGLVAARGRNDPLRTGRHRGVDRPGPRGAHLPGDPARRRAAHSRRPPRRGCRRPDERALRHCRRPAERDLQLGTARRLEGSRVDPDHGRHRPARPPARGRLRRCRWRR